MSQPAVLRRVGVFDVGFTLQVVHFASTFQLLVEAVEYGFAQPNVVRGDTEADVVEVAGGDREHLPIGVNFQVIMCCQVQRRPGENLMQPSFIVTQNDDVIHIDIE